MESGDPLKTVQLVLPVPILPPIPGAYALELLCEGERVGVHRVVVEEAVPRGGKPLMPGPCGQAPGAVQ